MTYKLVPHESGRYTVEFENGGCRPATDVEVALFKQREELLAALEELIELCTPSFCECEPDVGYQCRACHPSGAVKAARAAIARVKGGAE